MRLIDTHLHYDFLPPASRERFTASLAREGVEFIAQTVRPSGFVELERESLPMAAVGYHPWYINDNYERELEIFRAALSRTRFVGEIGLDFAPRRLDDVPAETQIHIFTSILDVVRASNQSHILSIHTVRSADAVLDLIEPQLDTSSSDAPGEAFVPIFHRFGGSSDELTRLIRAGGYISVNPLMLRTKRCRAYVAQVPVDRLLLETDLPQEPGSGDTAEVAAAEVAAALRETVAEVAFLRKMDEEELKDALANNAETLGI
ncbi:TatD family hydrolase [uncultured Corynebacterium sp.]|uniref:TatD family hydrolase n=1 Tax=uncultured Corynebacterium sp. TaxID=159447 RepID=UPI002622195A|nr:TatD family hydrolase [uncultured Corynebacterium sp.]